jgi:hypothetical protein
MISEIDGYNKTSSCIPWRALTELGRQRRPWQVGRSALPIARSTQFQGWKCHARRSSLARWNMEEDRLDTRTRLTAIHLLSVTDSLGELSRKVMQHSSSLSKFTVT